MSVDPVDVAGGCVGGFVVLLAIAFLALIAALVVGVWRLVL